MSTPKVTAAEALLRRRAFYLRIPRETLRAVLARNRLKRVAPIIRAKTRKPEEPR